MAAVSIDQNTPGEDSYLLALSYLTRYFHSPKNKKFITAGLPLDETGFTPNLFIRAAEKCGIEAKLIQNNLSKLKNIDKPVLVLLENNKLILILKSQSGMVELVDFENNNKIISEKLSTLKNTYTGYCIHCEPEFHFDQRAEVLEDNKKEKNWFWSVVHKAWPVYSEVIVASLLINFFTLAVPLFVMNVYDRVVPNNAIHTLWVLAAGVLVVLIFDFLLKLLRAYFIDMASKRIDVNLSQKVFSHLLGLRMDVRPQSVGSLSNTVRAFESFRDFITSATITVIIDLPFVLLFIGIIFLLGGPIGWIPLLVLPAVLLASVFCQIPLNKTIKESYKHSAEKQAVLIESLSGAETIKTMGAEGNMQRRWEQSVSRAAKLGVKTKFLSSTGLHLATSLQQFASIAVVVFGVYLISEGELTVGALIACTILTGRGLAPVSQVANLVSRYYESKTALESINQIMSLPADNSTENNKLHQPSLSGNITFRSVSFSYPNQKDKALDNINLEIKSGERIAIMGMMGSGKTTIQRLIMGLYSPTEGKICLDGLDAQQIHSTDIRSQIGFVPQDVMLFHGSVRDNIALGYPYEEDENIIRAAKYAGVTAFTDNHPEGLTRNVGERGMNLSGGQRQSIALARAELHSPNILLLDEPTNAMDDRSEMGFIKNLDQLSKNRTLIMVTHKRALLSLADRIIVLHQGRIIADGPKEEILRSGK